MAIAIPMEAIGFSLVRLLLCNNISAKRQKAPRSLRSRCFFVLLEELVFAVYDALNVAHIGVRHHLVRQSLFVDGIELLIRNDDHQANHRGKWMCDPDCSIRQYVKLDGDCDIWVQQILLSFHELERFWGVT